MNRPETYDVVVVGAGLAGLQCAKELGRAGTAVLLVDSKASLDRSIHTTGIFVRKTLEDFDLPSSCLGPPIRSVTLYSPARRSISLVSEHDEFRIGRMASLYAHVLGECQRNGVIWSPATRYMGCERSGRDSLLRLETEGRSRWVRARYLVAADGARSLVAQDLALDVNREWIVGVEEVYRGRQGASDPRLHCFLDPVLAPGYVAWIATDGEETHLGVGGYPARFDPLRSLNAFRASPCVPRELVEGHPAERRGGRIPVGGILRRLSSSRGLLVGDAAGAPSPLTAGGFDPCLRLSRFAAGIIVKYLDTGDPRILRSYTGDRFRSRFLLRRCMRRVLDQSASPAILEGICMLLGTPLLKRHAARIFFGRWSFPDLETVSAPRRARSSEALGKIDPEWSAGEHGRLQPKN